MSTLLKHLFGAAFLGLGLTIIQAQIVEDAAEVTVTSTGIVATDTQNLLEAVARVHVVDKKLSLVQASRTKPFRFNRPLEFKGEDGAGREFHVTAHVRFYGFEYSGPPKTAAFELSGVKRSQFEGINIILTTPGTTGVAIGVGKLGARDQSTSRNVFRNCLVTYATGLSKKTNIGFHVGRTWSRGKADVSAMNFDTVEADFIVSTDNTLNLNWVNSTGSWWLIESNHPALNMPHRQGGAASTWVNCGASDQDVVWRIPGGYAATIIGGRSEHCETVLDYGGGNMGHLVVMNHTGIDGTEENKIGFRDRTWQRQPGRIAPFFSPTLTKMTLGEPVVKPSVGGRLSHHFDQPDDVVVELFELFGGNPPLRMALAPHLLDRKAIHK